MNTPASLFSQILSLIQQQQKMKLEFSSSLMPMATTPPMTRRTIPGARRFPFSALVTGGACYELKVKS